MASPTEKIVQALYDEITNQSKFLKSDKAFAGPTKKGQSSGKMASTDEVRMDFAKQLAAKGVSSISQLGLKKEPAYTTYEVKQVPVYAPAVTRWDREHPTQTGTQWVKVVEPARFTGGSNSGNTIPEKTVPLTADEIKQLTSSTSKQLTSSPSGNRLYYADVTTYSLKQQSGTKNVVYNTATGQVLGDANADGSFRLGGTSKGDGITSYMVNFTPDGLPIFYGATKPTGLGELMSDIGPLADIAKVGLAFVPGGQPFAMAIQAMQTVAGGGDLGDVLEGMAKQYIASEIGGKVGSTVGAAVKGSDGLVAALGEKGAALATKATANVASAVTRAGVLGQDVEQAALGAVAASGGDLVLAGLSNQDWYKGITDPAAKAAIDSAVRNTVQAGVTGTGDVEGVLTAAAIDGGFEYAKQFMPPELLNNATPKQQKYVKEVLAKAVTGGLTDAYLMQKAVDLSIDYLKTSVPKNATASQLESRKLITSASDPTPADQAVIDMVAGSSNPTQTLDALASAGLSDQLNPDQIAQLLADFQANTTPGAGTEYAQGPNDTVTDAGGGGQPPANTQLKQNTVDFLRLALQDPSSGVTRNADGTYSAWGGGYTTYEFSSDGTLLGTTMTASLGGEQADPLTSQFLDAFYRGAGKEQYGPTGDTTTPSEEVSVPVTPVGGPTGFGPTADELADDKFWQDFFAQNATPNAWANDQFWEQFYATGPGASVDPDTITTADEQAAQQFWSQFYGAGEQPGGAGSLEGAGGVTSPTPAPTTPTPAPTTPTPAPTTPTPAPTTPTPAPTTPTPAPTTPTPAPTTPTRNGLDPNAFLSLLGLLGGVGAAPTTAPVYGTMQYADLAASPFVSGPLQMPSTKPPSETKMAGGGVVDPFAEPQSWDDFYRMLR